MTELLRQAISQIEKISPDQHDAIGSRFLAESKEEQEWETSFTATTDDQWERIAVMVRQKIEKEKPFDLIKLFYYKNEIKCLKIFRKRRRSLQPLER